MSIKDDLIEELENKKNSLEDLVSSKEEMILEMQQKFDQKVIDKR